MAYERGNRPATGAGTQASAGMSTGDDFPMLCESCLGPNPYVRMVKLPFGSKLCQLTEQPFQVFRWKPEGGRTKETIISALVAKERNICQGCLSDLRYGLTAGVRDALLQPDQPLSLPQSSVNSHYYYSQQAAMVEHKQEPGILEDLRNVPANRQLQQFSQKMHNALSKPQGQVPGAASGPVAWRNLPKLCTFWMGGTCSRVARKTCPFRPCNGQFVFPELASNYPQLHTALVDLCTREGAAKAMKLMDAETRDALKQSLKGNKQEAIRKRIHGEDELTNKYLSRMKQMNLELTPPADPTIVTLWVGGVTDEMTEQDLRDVFYAYGQIRHVHISRASKCAFVEYSYRHEAEHAAKMLYNSLFIRGVPLQLNWGRARAHDEGVASSASSAVAHPPEFVPPPPGLETAPASAYALKNLPLASNFFPTHPVPVTTAPSSGVGVTRPRDETADSADQQPAKRHQSGGPMAFNLRRVSAAPPTRSQAHTETQEIVAKPVRNKPQKPPAYPSMNPQRLGAKY